MKSSIKLSMIFLFSILLTSNDVKSQNGNYLKVTKNCYVEIDNISSVLSLQSGTIGFAFKLSGLSGDNLLFSMSNKQPSGSNNEFYINYRKTDNLIQTVAVVGGTVSMDAWTPTNSVKDTNWHHYTMVSDNAGLIKIYIDGKSQTLTAGPCCGGTTNDYFFNDLGTINNVKIGALERSTIVYNNTFAIDDFRIWNKSLSDAEVLTSIASPSSPPVTGLVLYYDFDKKENLSIGASGTNDIKDLTGNSQHGDAPCASVIASADRWEQSNDPISVYPNPVDNQLNLNFELKKPGSVEILIYDATGRVCFQTTENAGAQYSGTVNTTNFVPGCYTILIREENIIRHSRFIKSEGFKNN